MIDSLTVEQAASPPPDRTTLRSHRVGIGLYSLRGGVLERTDHVEVDVIGAHSDVPALRGKRADLVLVNDGDLAYAKVRLDPRSMRALTAHIGVVADPLARQLLWSASFDMVRDAELPARQFVAMAMRHVGRETAADAAQRVYGNALNAVGYGDPANRASLRALIARTARTQLDRLPAGSDLQLATLRSYIASEDGARGLTWLREVLDGDVLVPGVTIDLGLRWSILARLAATGNIDAARIAAEAARDNTDFGRRNAATLLASLPTSEAKQRAWDQLTEVDASGASAIPLQTMKSIMAGFDQPGQEKLLAEYIDRYVALVPRVWKERSREEAAALTSGLFPAYRGNPAVLAAAERLCAVAGLLPPARRILEEARDGVVRLQRAQQIDRSLGRRRIGGGEANGVAA